MSSNIKNSISCDLVDKIFNADYARAYLLMLKKRQAIKGLEIEVKNQGKNKGEESVRKPTTKKDLCKLIAECWDYETGKEIVRGMYQKTEKYEDPSSIANKMRQRISAWNKLGLGKIAWPCSQGAFDSFVQKVNGNKELNDDRRDKAVKRAAVQYRRIKEINTHRHDYIEGLIIQDNLEVLPTLTHKKGIDFFIDGIPFDLKISASPTRQFKEDKGENWIEEAAKRPEELARYLYTHQDEGRFDQNPRFLIVCPDDVSDEIVERAIKQIDLKKPLEIDFTYEHREGDSKRYEGVKCFVAVL